MPRLDAHHRVALLMHDALDKAHGKMGFGLLRYGVAPVVVAIDRNHAGRSIAEVTGISGDAPVVASVREALAYGPDVLVPAIAPPGGILPSEWEAEIFEGLEHGLSLVNGLHRPLATDPAYTSRLSRPEQFIWDVRQEPPGLGTAAGRARTVRAKRVLFVGTDMANGKMTAALEMDRAARRRGLSSRFLATGQIGIVIAGDGVPLDAVRVDFAAGAIEQMVMQHGDDHDVLLIEGQGSLLHPASTATLPLLRGAMPTHLILTHRAGQTHIARAPWVSIPPLSDVIRLYEQVAAASPEFTHPRVVGIALNTAHLRSDATARSAVEEVIQQTGLPTTDVVRFGVDALLDALEG
jgi:uncharacterized NAD-dependent epimerase/dehydratase family protein